MLAVKGLYVQTKGCQIGLYLCLLQEKYIHILLLELQSVHIVQTISSIGEYSQGFFLIAEYRSKTVIAFPFQHGYFFPNTWL